MSHIDDGWQPPPCKHGAQPIVWQEQVQIDHGGAFTKTIPGRKDFVYDCPTPDVCKWEALKQAQA